MRGGPSVRTVSRPRLPRCAWRSTGRPTLGTVHPDETVVQQNLRTVRLVEVAFVQWPSERDRREALQRARVPRLLLVAEDAPAPDIEDVLEDWLRLPASEHDVHARASTLLARGQQTLALDPVMDEQGILHRGDRWVALPPVEARMTAALLDRMGAVVTREALAHAGWPDGSPGRNAIDVHVLRLRRRLSPLNLVIRTVRSRGYLLESGFVQTSVAEA